MESLNRDHQLSKMYFLSLIYGEVQTSISSVLTIQEGLRNLQIYFSGSDFVKLLIFGSVFRLAVSKLRLLFSVF